MKNLSDKSCGENRNTHFMFEEFSPRIMPLTRSCGKILYSRTGHRRQYHMAHAHFMLAN